MRPLLSDKCLCTSHKSSFHGLALPIRSRRSGSSTHLCRAATGSDNDRGSSRPVPVTSVDRHVPGDVSTTSKSGSKSTTVLGSIFAVGGLLALFGLSVYYQDTIRECLIWFTTVIEDWGPRGVLAYFFVYTGLEVLAVPAIPLTMTAGAIFGIIPGSLLTSLAGTLAATISFLIARYAGRDRFLPWAEKNKQFRAVNRVIQTNGFQVVALLRLSPLLPLSASNYLYGLTSVSLTSYFFGSWLGMLPGTIAYVSAGHVGKMAFMEGSDLPLQWWQIAAAVAFSAGAIAYIGSLAKKALNDMEKESGASMDDMDSGSVDAPPAR